MGGGRQILRSLTGGALALGTGLGVAALVPVATLAPSGASVGVGSTVVGCPATPQVLTVGLPGTFVNGVGPMYDSVQAAVDAARPCDWVLVAPGDYKETAAAPESPSGDPNVEPAGVLVTTPRLHIRGLDRNAVVIDGTKSGPTCSNATRDQNFGPDGAGLNGIMVWKATATSVENLTVCNFLHGSGNTGNEIWWNGGDDSGQVGGWGYRGAYLNATSTYYHDENTAAQYGIFSSNWSGGTWHQTYASNFNDSGYYIGACQQVCDQTVDHAWAQYNALGYSGSNSGGVLVVKNSQFDHNEDGFDTNSQNGDNPPPQDGACPPGVTPPVVGAQTCWVFVHNWVHDNNDPYVPAAGSAAAGPVGTGLSISGGRNDTIMENRFENNGAWGVIFVPYPDSGPPCSGGTQLQAVCLFDENGDALVANTFGHNGFFGNPTNGDVGVTNAEPGPTDCFHGNSEEGGGNITTSPPLLQVLYPACNGLVVPPDPNPVFTDEVACDSGSVSIGPVSGGTLCPPGNTYPRSNGAVIMHPLPPAADLPSMPDPCSGVPANAWCPASSTYPPPTEPGSGSTSGSTTGQWGLPPAAGAAGYRRRL